jgi:hypothetical protein
MESFDIEREKERLARFRSELKWEYLRISQQIRALWKNNLGEISIAGSIIGEMISTLPFAEDDGDATRLFRSLRAY